MQAPTQGSQSSLLKPATVEQAAAKIGIFGPQGSGKSTTAAMIAIGASITYHNRAPVAFMDTENGSDFLLELFQAEGVPLVNFKSRAFVDMKAGIQEAKAAGCCLYLVDSYTHPWRELEESLKAKLNIKGDLQFHHQAELLSLWQTWTDLMLNSPLHTIVSGRLGYVWDREEDESGKKTHLVKLGTKMKSQNEAGYEPSLLIEMEGLPDAGARLHGSRAKKGSMKHFAYVLKDRWRTLNGRTFEWKDLNGYKVGDYEKVFKCFRPHFDKLAIGKTQTATNPARTSVALFDGRGQSAYSQRVKEVAIALEEIQGTLVALWPGQDATSKALKAAAIELLFATRSWTAVESKPLDELNLGLSALRVFEKRVAGGHDALTDRTAAIKLLDESKTQAASDLVAAAEGLIPDVGPVHELQFDWFQPR